MSGLEYAAIIPILVMLFPLSLLQMKVSLGREDSRAFFVWALLSGLVACLPLTTVAVSVGL